MNLVQLAAVNLGLHLRTNENLVILEVCWEGARALWVLLILVQNLTEFALRAPDMFIVSVQLCPGDQPTNKSIVGDLGFAKGKD